MLKNSLQTPFQKPPGQIDYFWFPLCALTSSLLIDIYLVPEAFMLPFLLFLIMGYLAIRVPGPVVFIWAAIFAFVLLAIVLFPVENVNTVPALKPYTRAGTFLTVGIVFTLLSTYRVRLENSYHALLSVVLSMPLPVIVSDISGNIVLMNTEAEKLLKTQFNDIAGLSFFTTFTNPDDQGKSIADYIDLFSANISESNIIKLQTRGEKPLMLEASVSISGLLQSRYAVTVITKIKEVAIKKRLRAFSEIL